MIISTFNKKINIYPELVISFLDWNNNSDNYIPWDFFNLDDEIFKDIDIEIHTMIYKNWNTYISSIVFRKNIDIYFNNLNLEKIEVIKNNDLEIKFINTNLKTESILVNNYLNMNFQWKIKINFLKKADKITITSIYIENYNNIIIENWVGEIKFKDYDYENIYNEWLLIAIQ